MSGQWEKYVEDPARLLDPDAFDVLDPHHAHWAMQQRREIARDRVRRVLGQVGPRIEQDTRVRLVAAAARAVERDCEPSATIRAVREDARQAMMDGLIAAAEEQERPSIAEWLRAVQ